MEKLKLTDLELKIFDARLKGLSFCQLDADQSRVVTDQILLRGAAITGCPLPNTEGFAEIISEEITTFLNEFGYKEYTSSEILLALRMICIAGLKYPSGMDVEPIVFTGHAFNTNYFSKVLDVYKTMRHNFDRKLQNFIDGY